MSINTFVVMTAAVCCNEAQALTIRRTLVLTCDEKFVASRVINAIVTYNAGRLSAIGNRALKRLINECCHDRITYSYRRKDQHHNAMVYQRLLKVSQFVILTASSRLRTATIMVGRAIVWIREILLYSRWTFNREIGVRSKISRRCYNITIAVDHTGGCR